MGGFVALKMELREVEGTALSGSAGAASSCTSLTAPCRRAGPATLIDVSTLDALVLLSPFLDVVRSPETSGPITATALSSIDRFLTYSILSPSSPNLALAMAQLSTAGTHCKFEASDSVSDEVVLLKILDVLRNCLTGPLGGVLSDESVCEMMETGLSMCCQMRLSGAPSRSNALLLGAALTPSLLTLPEMLRRSAERTMQAMVSAVFSRLRVLPTIAPDALALHPLSSSVSLVDSMAPAEEGALRMSAPDPRGAHIPAAGDGEALDVGEEELPEEEEDEFGDDDEGESVRGLPLTARRALSLNFD